MLLAGLTGCLPTGTSSGTFGGPGLDAGLAVPSPDLGSSTAGDAGPVAAVDAGPRDGGTDVCDQIRPVRSLLSDSCANNGACHVPGAQYPELSRGDLAALVNAPSRSNPSQMLVVPGEPSASWLIRKMNGTQGEGGGLLMPLGSAQPIQGVDVVETWVANGALTTCDEPAEPSALPPDPNALAQAELFTCTGTSASSPARLRRIERTEWTHATGRRVSSLAHGNPFFVPGEGYSTYAADLSIDATTLDLYGLVLPEGARIWTTGSPSVRLRKTGIYRNRELSCIFDQTAPDASCIQYYVTQLLERGVLHRTPRPEEIASLTTLLESALAAEGGDRSQRRSTLEYVVSAAWMTSAALFREEHGVTDPLDPTRARLSDDELALALGGVLGTHPPGAPLPDWGSDRPGPPDSEHPGLGWFGQIRAAADDGSIQSPTRMRELLARYRAGVDDARRDVAFELDARVVPARGEYWLAERIRGFFREWLDYESANNAFKDTPSATSAFEHREANLGFSNLQHAYYGHESTLETQLDDTIARLVIEAEAEGADVFRALLTGRTWRLPSNLMASNGVACETAADCASYGGYNRCPVGNRTCSGSTSAHHAGAHRVYGMTENVPDTQEGRWVQMPANERRGVLTHPAWLAAHGGNFEDDASAVYRGKWIRERLYCQTVPGLDLVQVEAKLVASAPELRARDRVRISTEEGEAADTCMGCHRLMNSLGMPFEIYNHAGFLRADDHGQAPDGSSTIDVAPDPSLAGTVEDATELAEMLADSGYARRCFVRQAFRYFMGRDETMTDACTLSQMESAFSGGSFFALLDALVTSDSFRYRHVETTP